MGGGSRPFRRAEENLHAAPGQHARDDHGQEQLNILKAAFEDDYVSLLHRLTATLRSRDKALESLHDAYLKLCSAPSIGAIRHPLAYLYRMALNLAHNARLRDARWVSAEPDIMAQLREDTPGPERTVIASHDFGKLLRILDQLPSRSREIWLARWRDERSLEEIATQFGLHKRTVQKQLGKVERLIGPREPDGD